MKVNVLSPQTLQLERFDLLLIMRQRRVLQALFDKEMRTCFCAAGHDLYERGICMSCGTNQTQLIWDVN
jgi:hypothetical protein